MSDGVGKPLLLDGGATDDLLVERASATPTAAPSRRRGTRRTQHPAASAPLRDLQRHFLRVITDPTSVDAGLAAAARQIPGAVYTDGPQLDAAARLDVYHYAYRARLVECLADDFPCVQGLVGASRFETLAAAYIAAHPSRHPNLNGFGAGFPTWLRRGRSPLRHRAALADIADLEWALVEVLHAPAAPVLDPAALQALPPEAWPDLRLRPSATLRLLRSRHPANTHFEAWRQDQPVRLGKPAPAAVAVFRQGWQLRRMDLSPLTEGLLRDLLAGKPLGQSLDRCARRGRTISDLVPKVMEWFRAWVAGGFFAAID